LSVEVEFTNRTIIGGGIEGFGGSRFEEEGGDGSRVEFEGS